LSRDQLSRAAFEGSAGSSPDFGNKSVSVSDPCAFSSGAGRTGSPASLEAGLGAVNGDGASCACSAVTIIIIIKATENTTFRLILPEQIPDRNAKAYPAPAQKILRVHWLARFCGWGRSF